MKVFNQKLTRTKVTFVALFLIFHFKNSSAERLSTPLEPADTVYSYAGIALGPLICGYDATFKRNIEFQTSPLNVLKKGRDAGLAITAFFDHGTSRNFGMRFSLSYEIQKLSNSYEGAAFYYPADSINYPVSSQYVNTAQFLTFSTAARYDLWGIIRLKGGLVGSFPVANTSQSESYLIHKKERGGKDEMINVEGSNLDQPSYWGIELEAGIFFRLKREFVLSISCAYRDYFNRLPEYTGNDPWKDANARNWDHTIVYTERSIYIVPIKFSLEKGFSLD